MTKSKISAILDAGGPKKMELEQSELSRITITIANKNSPTYGLTVSNLTSYDEYSEFFNAALVLCGCSGLKVGRGNGSDND